MRKLPDLLRSCARTKGGRGSARRTRRFKDEEEHTHTQTQTQPG